MFIFWQEHAMIFQRTLPTCQSSSHAASLSGIWVAEMIVCVADVNYHQEPGIYKLQTLDSLVSSITLTSKFLQAYSIIDILTSNDTCLHLSKLFFFEKGVDILSVDNPGNVMYSRIHPATIDVTP